MNKYCFLASTSEIDQNLPYMDFMAMGSWVYDTHWCIPPGGKIRWTVFENSSKKSHFTTLGTIFLRIFDFFFLKRSEIQMRHFCRFSNPMHKYSFAKVVEDSDAKNWAMFSSQIAHLER